MSIKLEALYIDDIHVGERKQGTVLFMENNTEKEDFKKYGISRIF